ncbi:hypothetical protein BDC45DRAFT_536643 [Circinella umbellata]|nr:hypothetical protein BDC45DRAFT_536643 [Circinella umbellata]
MVHYFYQSEQKEDSIKWYIDCEWNNNLDFESNPMDLDICTITLNNVNDYWTSIVTRKDLDNFMNPNAILNKLNQVVTKGLQGETDFEGQELSWKINQEKNKCEMSLIGYMAGSLPYQLGSIHVTKVTSLSEKQKVMENWMENTTKQYQIDKQTRNALSARNKDLELNRKQMEKELENLTQEKVESDMMVIEKMKQLINSKKRRVHKVMMERNQLLKQVEAQQALDNNNKQEQSIPSSSLPQTIPKKRGRPTSSSSSIKNENTQVKRTRTNPTVSTRKQKKQKLIKEEEEDEDDDVDGEEGENENKSKNAKQYNLRRQKSIQSSGDETDDGNNPIIASNPITTSNSSNTVNTTTETRKVKFKDIKSSSDDNDDSDDMFAGVVPKLRRRINSSQSSKSKGKRIARNASDESDTD